MSSLSHLALLHADSRVVAALRFGFEREGTNVFSAESAEALDEALEKGSQLIITGGRTSAEATDRLTMAQGVMLGADKQVRVLYFGNSISRQEAFDGGAHEFLPQPAFIRDVVTLAKLMATPMERRTQSISGELGEHFGVFYLVRALGAIQYTGVLNLLRGLRRGELRFFQGDVTSAQMGGLHGLSALHQALLWTNARFDLREEAVVRRQQIPMERAELVRDCQRFLEEIQSIAGGLSPSAVLERNPDADRSKMPAQVLEVLDLFDGTGSVADVIEDSPYRIFETLRIACRLSEQGLVRRASKEAPKHLMHTALAIEEWLVGGDVTAPVAPEESRPIGPAKGKPASPPRKAAKGQAVAAVPAIRNEQSWSDVLPGMQTTEDLSQVVPSSAAVGEILAKRPTAASAADRVTATLPKLEVTTGDSDEPGLSKVFVDASWGATDLGARGAVPEPEVDPSLASSWEEETSPATRHALASIASGPAPEPEDVVPIPVPTPIAVDPSVQVDLNDNVEISAEENPAPVVEPVVEARAEAVVEPVVEAAAEAVAEAVVEPVVEARVEAKVEINLDAQFDPNVAIPSGYDPERARQAHKRVTQTAHDGQAAAAAAMAAKVLRKVVASKKRADSKSESDAKDVQTMVASASSASSEAAHFSADEEAFFNRGVSEAKTPAVVLENFEDLDEDYEVPRTFWQRFLADPDLAKRKKK